MTCEIVDGVKLGCPQINGSLLESNMVEDADIVWFVFSNLYWCMDIM